MFLTSLKVLIGKKTHYKHKYCTQKMPFFIILNKTFDSPHKKQVKSADNEHMWLKSLYHNRRFQEIVLTNSGNRTQEYVFS